MNVSYRWLKKLAPGIEESAKDLADRLTRVAVPVDEVIALGEGLEDIVIGRVTSVDPHPNADRLVICQVDVGDSKTVQVVTGAPNTYEGAYYPFVGVGGVLPGGIEIKKVKLRGEPSAGMLCSERELGLGRAHEGVMQLQGEYEPGASFVETMGFDDYRLVLDITPNRPDLLGHYGVAREVAPGGQADLELPGFPGHEHFDLQLERSKTEGETGGISVSLEDTRGCSRFVGVAIRGVEVGPSPEWLARDLRAIGLQPINNVVDATNYVMYELNQPIHAYDLPTIGDGRIVVRRAQDGEKVRTLDGKDRKLTPEVLVIGDGRGVNGLAGLMGGEASEVGEETQDVFVEAAYFDPLRVRKGARSLGMDTDASYRFQRGVDGSATHRAMERVVNLIHAVAGGTVESPGIDVIASEPRTTRVDLRPERASYLLGLEFDASTIGEYLEKLGFEVALGEGGTLNVSVPGWRPDIEREVDLIEEVARRHGYDRFPDHLGPFRPTRIPEEEYAGVFDRIRETFVGLGFLESRSLPLGPEEEGEIEILNPLSEVESHLRGSLLAGLIRSAERNFAQGTRDVRLFELGTAFGSCGGDVPAESLRLAAVWTGNRHPPHWSTDAGEFDVWDLKWLLEIATQIAARGSEVRPTEASELEPPLEAPFAVVAADGQRIGWGGRIPAERVETPRWAGPVWGLELEVLTTAEAPRRYQALPVYPPSDRDLALIVPTGHLAAQVEAVMRRAAPEILERLWVFDVYEGENLPEDTRSIAWRLRFRAPDRTLTDEEVDAAMASLVTALEKELDVSVRGA